MFSSTIETPPNEHGEYEILKGISAGIFRAVIVRGRPISLLYGVFQILPL